MSRTDKDAPYWVRAEFYRPAHDWICPVRRLTSEHACTLPSVPVRGPYHAPRSRPRLDGPLCVWIPYGWDRGYYTRPPRRDDRRIFFHGPNRRQMRDFTLSACQLYRAFGEVDDIIEPTHAPSQLDWWD